MRKHVFREQAVFTNASIDAEIEASIAGGTRHGAVEHGNWSVSRARDDTSESLGAIVDSASAPWKESR